MDPGTAAPLELVRGEPLIRDTGYEGIYRAAKHTLTAVGTYFPGRAGAYHSGRHGGSCGIDNRKTFWWPMERRCDTIHRSH